MCVNEETRPIAYASCTLRTHEKNYPTRDLELVEVGFSQSGDIICWVRSSYYFLIIRVVLVNLEGSKYETAVLARVYEGLPLVDLVPSRESKCGSRC